VSKRGCKWQKLGVYITIKVKTYDSAKITEEVTNGKMIDVIIVAISVPQWSQYLL